MEQVEDQHRVQAALPRELGLSEFVERVERLDDRYDSTPARVVIALGALLVLQVASAKVIHEGRDSSPAAQVMPAPVHLSAESKPVLPAKPVIINQAPKKKPASRAKAKPRVSGLSQIVPFPNPHTNNLKAYFDISPSLDELAAAKPGSFNDIAEQKAAIAELEQSVTPTLAEYRSFRVDTLRNTAFKDHPFYKSRITPKMFVVHWTGQDTVPNVETLVKGMMGRTKINAAGEVVPNRVSAAYFISSEMPAVTYQLVP